jgi:hypothetical protein
MRLQAVGSYLHGQTFHDKKKPAIRLQPPLKHLSQKKPPGKNG